MVHHQKLQVHYRIHLPGETTTVWISGPTAGDTLPEKRHAWRAMTRTQWFPSWLQGKSLEQALSQELERSHPTAKGIVIDHVNVLR